MVVIAGTEEILESYDSEVYESHQREQNFVYNHKNGNFGDDMENNEEMSNCRQDGINEHKLQRNEWSGKMNQPTGSQDDSSESIDEQNEQSFDRVQSMTKETGDNENSSEDVSSQELPGDYWFGETNDTDHVDDNKLNNDDLSSNMNNQGMLNYNWLKQRMTEYHDWLSNVKNQNRKDSDYLENSAEVTADTDDQLKNTNIENGRSYSWFGNNGNGEKRNDQWPYVMVDGREIGGEDEGRSGEKELDRVKRQHRLIKQGADHHD